MFEKYFYDNNHLNKNKLKETWVKKYKPVKEMLIEI